MAWRGSPAQGAIKGANRGVNEAQQLTLPWPVVGAVIIGAVSFTVFVLTNWWNGERERLTRSRDVFSKAYAGVQEYKEFPYVIVRRRKDTPEEERIRISSELRRVQADLAFYSAWLRTESRHVHRSFSELLKQARNVAGTAMHEAWLQPAAAEDSKMNMPKLDMSALAPYESAYLEEVVDHLSLWPRWTRRLLRRKPKA